MRFALIAGFVVALVIGVGVVVSMKTDRIVGWCRWKSVDEAEYVAGNRAILDELPIYPGAARRTSGSTGLRASDACVPVENGPPYDRFMTTDSFTLPPEGRNIVTAPWKSTLVRAPTRVPSVLVYYDRELREDGWQRSGWSGHEIYFERGSANLAVSAQLNINDPYKREPYHQLGVYRD